MLKFKSESINQDKQTKIILLSALLIGLILRFLFLGSKSLWFDEAAILDYAITGKETTDPFHPPLYYIMMKYWILVGKSEFMLRLPSAFWGIISVYLIFIISKDLINKSTALSTVWLAALSPLFIWYSQEARSYSFTIFIGLLSTAGVVKLFLKPNLLWLFLFIVGMILCLYTHYVTIFLLPIQIIVLTVLLSLKRSKVKCIYFWLFGWLIIIISYLPWLKTPEFKNLILLFMTNQSYYAQMFYQKFHIVISQILKISLIIFPFFLLIIIFVISRILKKYKESVIRFQTKRSIRVSILILFVISLIVFIIPAGFSIKRLLAIYVPYALLIVGWFFPWKKDCKIFLTSLLFSSFIASLINIILIPKDQWRETVQYIHQQYLPGDLIIIQPPYMISPFKYYNKEKISINDLNSRADRKQLDSLTICRKRIWLVFQKSDFDERIKLIQSWLDSHLKEINICEYYNIKIQIYQH